jgi:hypothetical protein
VAVGAARATGAVAIAAAAAPVANTIVRFFNLICILNTFSMSPYLDSFQNCSFGNLLSSPATPVLAFPLAGIRTYRWQVAEQSAEEVARQPSTASFAGASLPADAVGAEYEHRGGGDSTSGNPGRDRGTRQSVRELACGDQLRLCDQFRSDLSWQFVALNSIGAHDFSGARVCGRLHDGTIREPQLFRYTKPVSPPLPPSIRPLA